MDWKTSKLDDVLTRIIGGGTPSKSRPEYWHGDIPWASVKDMADDKFRLIATKDYITQEGLDNSATNLIPKGTVITATRMGLGRCFINQVDMSINQDLKALIPNDKINNDFLLWLVVSKASELENLGTGTTVKGIRLEDLRSLEFHLPPLSTQQKIASSLSAYDDLIENNNRRIAILEEMSQKLYREWFVKFRFPGHEDVKMVSSEFGEIPEGWEAVKIADIYKTSSGGTPSRKKPEYYDNGHIPWVKTKELKDCFVIESEEKITDLGLKESSAKLFPKHSVLLAMYGATIGKLGIIAQEASSNQACCALIVKEESFSPWYVYLYLYSNRNHIIGQRMGAAQQNISQQIIKDFSILKPTTKIMNGFNEIVEPMFMQIENLQKKNRNLKQQRDLLLPKLISGKIDV